MGFNEGNDEWIQWNELIRGAAVAAYPWDQGFGHFRPRFLQPLPDHDKQTRFRR
jgi:hypothetical protein